MGKFKSQRGNHQFHAGKGRGNRFQIQLEAEDDSDKGQVVAGGRLQVDARSGQGKYIPASNGQFLVQGRSLKQRLHQFGGQRRVFRHGRFEFKTWAFNGRHAQRQTWSLFGLERHRGSGQTQLESQRCCDHWSCLKFSWG